jgi:hypothetical protein
LFVAITKKIDLTVTKMKQVGILDLTMKYGVEGDHTRKKMIIMKVRILGLMMKL